MDEGQRLEEKEEFAQDVDITLDVTLNEISELKGGLTAENILTWCYKQYNLEEGAKSIDDLKEVLEGIMDAKKKYSYNARVSHLFPEHFVVRVFEQNSIAYINDPDEGQEFNLQKKEEAEDGEELTKEQIQKNKNRKNYLEVKAKQTFFAQLMQDILATVITDKSKNLKFHYVPHNNDKKNPLEAIFPGLNPVIKGENKAKIVEDKVVNFQLYCNNLRRKLVKPLSNEEPAEERHIFKAEARMYHLLIDPTDKNRQDACVELSKKLTGHVNWKYIGIGILLIAIAATIIGVTCGAAAGAFALLGIGVAGWIGISTMIGFLTTALTIGYKGVMGGKAKNASSPLNKLPGVGKVMEKIPPVKGLRHGLPHGLSSRFFAVAKAADPKKNPKIINGMQEIKDVQGKALEQ